MGALRARGGPKWAALPVPAAKMGALRGQGCVSDSRKVPADRPRASRGRV